MSDPDLMRRLRLGEDSRLELKSVRVSGGNVRAPERNAMADELAALCQQQGRNGLHLRQANRNELIVSLLARCKAPSGVGRTRLMDTRGDGVPIIRRACRELSGRLPEDRLIDDSELRLVIWAAGREQP